MAEIESKKFGTFSGVFIPSILTILGVIMYLRMGWVVGNIGINQTFLVVTISSLVTLITGLSISATATNMKVGAGGAYYMISRSFGLEPGAAIGIPLFFAQTISVAFYITGFAESLSAIFPNISMKLVGIVTLLLIFATVFYSTDLALKAQTFIFVIIILSLLSLFLGSPLDGFDVTLNQPTYEVSFWVVFAVFFPAVTGILSGVSMSGDLKKPSFSIPIGTISAVIVGYIIYMVIPWYLWNSADSKDLIADSLLMKKISLFSPLIFLGIWGATLSSALGSLLSAPRTLMALANDKVLPKFLARTNNKDVPTTATIISFLFALICIVAGEFNIIAPILTMFFLTTYAVLNLTAGMEAYIGNPSWRPVFQVPWFLSLFGALSCIGIMLMINAGATYIALIIIVSIYMYLKKRDIEASWSDIRPNLLIYNIRNSLYKLSRHSLSEKSWRPNIVSLAKKPMGEMSLFSAMDRIAQGGGFSTVAISTTSLNDAGSGSTKSEFFRGHLLGKGIESFVKICDQGNYNETALNFIKYYGIGPVKPNIYTTSLDYEEDALLNDYSDLGVLVANYKKNLILTNSSEEFSEKSIKSIKKPTISIWWGQKNDNNCHLMLSLALLLRNSPGWKKTKIVIRTLVGNNIERKSANISIQNLIKESRIKGVSHDVTQVSDVKDTYSCIANLSEDSFLTFLGVQSPIEFENNEVFKSYHKKLIQSTSGIKNLFLVQSEENINLKKLFLDT